MLGYALVDGFSRADPALALLRLKHAALAVGGTIVDFAVYAREAVRFGIELPSGALPRLRDALEAEDVHLFDQSRDAIAKLHTGSPDKPVLAMLHVALLGEVDGERPLPPAPT